MLLKIEMTNPSILEDGHGRDAFISHSRIRHLPRGVRTGVGGHDGAAREQAQVATGYSHVSGLPARAAAPP